MITDKRYNLTIRKFNSLGTQMIKILERKIFSVQIDCEPTMGIFRTIT
jgi:hypothetical protein